MHGVNTYLQWNSIMPARFWWLPPAATLHRISMCVCVWGWGWAPYAWNAFSQNFKGKTKGSNDDVNCCDRCLSPTPSPPLPHHHLNRKHTHTKCLFCVSVHIPMLTPFLLPETFFTFFDAFYFGIDLDSDQCCCCFLYVSWIKSLAPVHDLASCVCAAQANIHGCKSENTWRTSE